LDVGTLRLPGERFDPQDPQMRQMLMESLGVNALDIRSLSENVGLNGGVWVLSDPHKVRPDMIMKSRPFEARPIMPPEAEHFVNLYRQHPALASDPDVVFPTKILACLGPDGMKRNDLIIMRKAPGMTLAYYIGDKYYSQDPSGRRELMAVFESIGRNLRAFQARYGGKQHTDFQTSNIMVDTENGNKITFIDLGGVGHPVGHSDTEHFGIAVRMLQDAYPPASFLEMALSNFDKGYYSHQVQEPQMVPPQQAPQHSTPQYAEPQYAAPQYSVPQQPIPQQPVSPQTEAQTPEADAATAFRVSMPRAQNESLGLSLKERDGRAIVHKVKAGLIAQWNKRHPDFEVQAGQRIYEINGRSGSYQELLKAAKSCQSCAGSLAVGDAVEVWSRSQGNWVADGRVTEVNAHDVVLVYGGGELSKTLPIDSVEVRRSGNPMFEMVVGLAVVEPTEKTTALRTIRVSVTKQQGEKLGLQLVNRNGAPEVKQVVGGAAGRWNSEHPDSKVKAGHRIVEINGRRDSYEELLSLCKHEQTLKIIIEEYSPMERVV